MSEVHVDAVRAAFLKMYGPGDYVHSDVNERAAKVFDGWVESIKAKAWDEGARDGCMCQPPEVPNPYREEPQ